MAKKNNLHRLKAKKKAIKTLKNEKKAESKTKDAIRSKNPEIEITKTRAISHPNTIRKIREKNLARGNSAAVKVDFAIDPEDYLDKPLVFDLKMTTEDEIFDWLVTNMAVDNDIYYIEHKDGSNIFRIRKENNS